MKKQNKVKSILESRCSHLLKINLKCILIILFVFLITHSGWSQTNPGGVLTSTENVFWLRSGNGISFDDVNFDLSEWSDQANSNNASNSNTATNPIYDTTASVGTNAESAILFNSTNSEFLEITDDATINTSSITERTIYLVFKTGADVTTTQYLYQQGDATNGIFAYISTNVLTLGINSAATTYDISTATLAANTDYIARFKYDGGSATLDLSLNGTASTQETSVATSIATHNTIKLGSDTGDANFLNGHIAEIVYYNTILNDGQIRVVDNFLSEKYGITEANDHYTAAGTDYRFELTGIANVGGEEQNASNGLGSLYLSEYTTDPLSNGAFVFAGNNAGILDLTASDMSDASVEGFDRLNRIWFFEKTGNLGVTVEFDLVEAGFSAATDAKEYELITRSGTTGDFVTVSLDSRVINGNKIQFNVSDVNWTSGYYTLATLASNKSWYVINSGDWDDPNTWTLDPAGVIYDNPDLLTPSTSSTSSTDDATILSGKTVTITNDGDIPTSIAKITVNGTLDFGSTSGHGTIVELLGNGTIMLSGDDATIPRANNLPTITDASNFTTTGIGGGIIEYYGSEDIEITGDFSFYNLRLDFDNTNDHLIIATTNTTVNGDLIIANGDFQINDNTSGAAAIRNITILGDVTVASTGSISTGTGNTVDGVTVSGSNYYDAFHQFEVQGNFTNNGTVRFHNESFPVFRSGTTSGATTTTFTGLSDNTASLNGETSFYNIRVNKGTDQTYQLVINAADKSYFYLFGQNNLSSENIDQNSNPSFSGKALWIENGTLELQGSTRIPTLIELLANTSTDGPDSPFFVPENGKLILNGPDVIVNMIIQDKSELNTLWGDFSSIPDSEIGTTLDNNGAHWRNFLLHGHLTIEDGLLDFNNAAALQYDAETSPIIEVNGGEMILIQLRPITPNSGGDPTYIQTGGTVQITGNSDGENALINGGDVIGSLFSFPSPESVFLMSGGEIFLNDVRLNKNAINGLNIQSAEGNYSVTGGTITVDVGTNQTNATDPFEIDFTPNFHNLTITNGDGDPVEFFSNLVVNNDFIIEGTNSSEVDVNNYDLTIGRNLNIETGATLTLNGNTSVIFNGSAGQSIIIDGSLTSFFYDVTFSNSGVKTVEYNSETFVVSNLLTIESGATLINAGNNLKLLNSVSNSGTYISSGSNGQIVFNTAATTIDGDGTGVFDNILFRNTDSNPINTTTVYSDFTVTGRISFKEDNTALDLETSRLTLSGPDARIINASELRMILTAGNDSDGGLSMNFDADETLTFPIGTDANGVTRYTPVEVTVSNFSDEGNIIINPVDSKLSTTDLTASGELLSYYWKVDSTGFDGGTPDVVYTFTYDNSDTHTGSQLVTADNYEAGRVLDDSPYTRSSEGIVIDATNDISFSNSFALEKANYTAGEFDRFTGAPLIFYSKEQTSGISFLDDWSDADRWTRSDLTGFDGTSPHRSDNPSVNDAGASGNQYPQAGDIAIIGFVPFDDANTSKQGDPHHVHIENLTEECALLSFTQMTDISGNPVARDEDRFWAMRPSVLLGGTALLNADVVEGEGEFFIRLDGDHDFSNVDLGDFVNQDSSLFFYEGNNSVLNTYNNVPSELSNLIIGSTSFGSDDRTIEITTDFILNQNLEILGDANFILPDGTDVIVGGNIRMFETSNNGGSDGGAEIRFPNSGSATTLTVLGDIIIENEGAIISVNSPGTTPLQHTINLYGSVFQDSDGTGDDGLQLWTNDGEDFISLNLIGDKDATYEFISGDVPSFSNIVVNKGNDTSTSFTFNSDFNLAPPTASLQPIVLENGTFVLNDTGIGDAGDVILTNEINDTDFNLPNSTALQVTAGTLTFEGDDLGIILDGSLTIDGGTINLNGGNNNYIEYSSSGNAFLTISGGALNVGSQIRRNAISPIGILNYNQTGGSIIIGENTGGSPSTNRSMFEVTGTGSSFSMTGGSMTIANNLSNKATPTLYLDPDGSPTTGSTTIRLGNDNTVSGFNEMTIQSEVDFFNLYLITGTGASPKLTMLNIPLTVRNELFMRFASLDASGLDLNIGEDFNSVGSTFTSNGNTTTFNGTKRQRIVGDGTEFYNLIKSGSNTLQLESSTSIMVSNNLSISDGILDDNNNDITVGGILHNVGTHTNTSGTSSNNGIILSGNVAQDITGAGTYSRIRVNNTSGVTVNADINITEQIILDGTVLDIQDNELSLDDDAIFVDASGVGFSTSNMIETRRSFTDAGIIKVFNGIDTDGAGDPTFIYPIGSGDKYTPIMITLTQNSQTNATIAVRAADEQHPNVQEDVDIPEFVDQNNVLQYYWELTSSGMTDFTGEIKFTYVPSDAYVTSPFTLEDYFTARLLPDASNQWNKIETGFNYLAADGESTILFDLSTPVGDDGIGGQYTSGVEDAIPDEVQTVTSVVNTSGEWTTDGSWDTGTVPRGANVIIETGDQIIISTDVQVAYDTQIDGELIIGHTQNHRLGNVSGSGIIRINSGSLPAGDYTEFFDCTTGGTIDFGSADSYTLPDEIETVKNLEVSDGGTKSFPNTDIVICGNLTLDGSTTLDNPQNVSITVLGDLIITDGTMDIGSGVTMIVEGSANVTTGSLEIGNNTLIVEESLTMNGGTINMSSNGLLDIDQDLILTSGTLNGENTSSITIGGDLSRTAGLLVVSGVTNTVTFDGSVAQSIIGDFTGGNSFNSLEIDNASGLTVIDGGNDIEINGVLTFTEGIITTNDKNMISITSSGSSSGGSSTSFINGPLTKMDVNASDDFSFHIGAGTSYAFAGIENVGTGGQDWTAEFFESNSNSGQAINTTINSGFGGVVQISTSNSWNIEASGSNSATIVLGIQSHSDVKEILNVRVMEYDKKSTGEWVNLGGTATGNINNGLVTSQDAADFSSTTLTIGGTTVTALPVNLISFNGAVENEEVVLSWITASEINNDYFELERSTDGVSFEYIGSVNGNGTTNEQSDYSFIDDRPYAGVSYYRLTQTDFDGAFEILETITLTNNSRYEGIDLTLFPNPTSAQDISIRVTSGDENTPITVLMYHMTGALVHSETLNSLLGTHDYKVNANSNLSNSIYQVIVSQGSNKTLGRIIIK